MNTGPEDLDVLRAVVGIVGAAAVAKPDVEKAVRAELDHAPVVVTEWVVHHQQHELGRVGDIGVREGGLILGDHDGAVGLPRVVDEEAPIVRVARMKRQPEQAALAPREHKRRDVEENRRVPH